MESSKYCAICSGGITRAKWTWRLNTVLIRDNRVDFGYIHFNKNALKQSSRSLIWPEQHVSIRLIPSSNYTPTDAFILHESCYRLLCNFAQSKIQPIQAFGLCQAMQPDWDRQFPKKSISTLCPDPFGFLKPQDCFPPLERTYLVLQPDATKNRATLFARLPPEVLLLALGYLSPSDLVNLFMTCKLALSYANIFCRSNPLHFFRCSAHTGSDKDDKRLLMIALSNWAHYHELDLRRHIVAKVAEAAKLLPSVDVTTSSARALDPRSPLLHSDHRYGLYGDILDIPDTVQKLEVYSTQLNGLHYICGIGFDAGLARSFVGYKTKSSRVIDISDTSADTIWLAEDALGVRSLRYDSSSWSFGDPRHICCWEGLSVRKESRSFRIIRDALKFRYLSWLHQSAPTFEETILVRNGHPSRSSQGIVSEELYVRQRPEQEYQLVKRFGRIPTEAICFGRNLKEIKTYAGDDLHGISGLAMCTITDDHHVGFCEGMSSSMTLRTPSERLAEIEVWTSEVDPLALILRTNQNRELSSEPRQLGEDPLYSMQLLRPASDHCITGLLLWFDGSGIASVGLIVDRE